MVRLAFLVCLCLHPGLVQSDPCPEDVKLAEEGETCTNYNDKLDKCPTVITAGAIEAQFLRCGVVADNCLSIHECSGAPKAKTQSVPQKFEAIDFTWGDKHGLKFKRVKGVNNDMFPDNCDYWGYSGGSQNDQGHGSSRIKTRKAVWVQRGDSNDMQNIEFHFCKKTSIAEAVTYPVHGGHTMQRGTLQYMDAAGQWTTLTTGQGAKITQGVKWVMSNTKDLFFNRWRIHDWRCGGNQRMDGIDLKGKRAT